MAVYMAPVQSIHNILLRTKYGTNKYVLLQYDVDVWRGGCIFRIVNFSRASFVLMNFLIDFFMVMIFFDDIKKYN